MSIHLFRRRALVIAGGSLVGSVLYLHNRARYGDDAMYSNKESYRPSFLFSTARRLPIVAEAQQQEQQQQLRDSVGSDGSPSEDFSSCMMREPRSLRDRFLQYARRDEETGEYVQLLGDFVACILLLDSDHSSNSLLFNSNNNNSSSSSLGKSSSADTASSSSSSRMTFPSSVQHRVEALFEMVDIDSSKSVTYAEFVVLFTLLSTRYSTLKLAFNMFDLDDNGRLDELEFSRLLNTVMVDPAVQIQYRDPQRVAAADDHAGVLDASSVAGAAWGSRRTRSRKGGPELSYSISSDSLSRWLRGVLPHHTDAPRGSKHHKGGGIYRTFVQAHELARLHRMNEEDHAQRAISFENFWYRVHYLRWELRAIEFSILDTTHTGMISIDACRRLLVGKGAAATAMHTGASTEASPSLAVSAADARVSSPWWSWTSLLSYIVGLSCRPSAPTQPRPMDEHTPCISWQFYQKIFDIIRDSDLTLPALQLALDAAPPLPLEDLQGGAVPDEKRALSSVCHADVKQCGQQLPAVEDTRSQLSPTGTSSEAAEGEALHTHSTATNTTTTNNNNNNNITGTTPSPLVRPTALTYRQFNAALRSCDHFLPVLSEEEQRIFCELFDFDKSGTLTPSEFAQLCEMKRSFFAQRLPAFSQPRRNPVQQFFYCMQQLD